MRLPDAAAAGLVGLVFDGREGCVCPDNKKPTIWWVAYLPPRFSSQQES
jgi:hypothetical protein